MLMDHWMNLDPDTLDVDLKREWADKWLDTPSIVEKMDQRRQDLIYTYGSISKMPDHLKLYRKNYLTPTSNEERELTAKQQIIVKKVENLKNMVLHHVRVSERTCEYWSDVLNEERRVAQNCFSRKRQRIICMEERLKRLKICANEVFTELFPPWENGSTGELEREKAAKHLATTTPTPTTTSVSETETQNGGMDTTDSEPSF